jgi:glycogen operon protein
LAFGAELPRQGLRLHLILNAYWEPLDFELPAISDGKPWRRWIDTMLDPPQDIVDWTIAPPVLGESYRAGPRSVVALYASLGADVDRSRSL